MDEFQARATIFRFDPTSGQPSRYEQFELPVTKNMRVLDVLRSIYETQAGDLAFQYACRVGRCGTCAVIVNGRPVLACQERVKPKMKIEPLSPFPVLRDLIIDYSEAEKRYSDLNLAPIAAGGSTAPAQDARGRATFAPDHAREVGLMGSCLACMVCVSACPAVKERAFDGPAYMLQLRRLSEHPADHGARLEQALDGGLLECFSCGACAEVCPADLSPAVAIRDFRREMLLGQKRHKHSNGEDS
jgi:fumarate reductase (CoM/CoB) subunit B